MIRSFTRRVHFSTFVRSQEVLKADKYIGDNLRDKEWINFLISNYFPSQIRPDFKALMWFNHLLARIPENASEPSLALGKLQFWKDIVDKVYNNQKATLEPVSVCLTHLCQNNPITKQFFTNLIEARRFEVHNKQINTVLQLFQICERIRTSLIFLQWELLRIPLSDDLTQIAIEVGRATGIVDYIKRIPYNLRSYRLYIPEEINAKHNISVRNLWDRTHGRPREELFDAVLEVAAFARESLIRAKKLEGKLPPQAFRALLSAVEAELYLEQLEKCNFNVFQKSINQPPVLHLPFRLFSAARAKKFLYKLQ